MQVFNDIKEGVETATGLNHSLPAGKEAGEGALLYGLDFLSQLR